MDSSEGFSSSVEKFIRDNVWGSRHLTDEEVIGAGLDGIVTGAIVVCSSKLPEAAQYLVGGAIIAEVMVDRLRKQRKLMMRNNVSE